MAFPSVRSSIVTNGTSASATPAVNLPATIAAGDVIFVLFRVAVAGAIGWPDATWNELFDESPDASDDQWAAAWRKADGTEGATITLSCTSGKFSAIAWAIQDSIDPATRPPQLSTVATGSGTQPNATTCTPTGGAKDYLWLTFYGMEGEQTGITTYPTSYTLAQQFANSGTAGAVTTNCTLGGAARQLNAASEDAAAWTVGGTLDDWSAYTIAFHPAVAVTTASQVEGIGRVRKRWVPKSWESVPARSLWDAVQAQPIPPGAQKRLIRPPRQRVVVATQTLPAETVNPLPPGDQVRGKPARRIARRRVTQTQFPPPVVAPDVLLPGVQSFAPVAFHPRVKPWAWSPIPPDFLPPGQQRQTRPPTRLGRRTTTWATIPQDQDMLPPGQQLQGHPAGHPVVRGWAIGQLPPIPPDTLPTGQASFAKPAKLRSNTPWSNSPAQPAAAVVDTLLPGAQLQGHPPTVRATRSWAVSTTLFQIAPPPGSISQVRPRRSVRAARTFVAPFFPDQALPAGQQANARRRLVPPHARPLLVQVQPPVVAQALPIGVQLQGHPAQRPPMRTSTDFLPPFLIPPVPAAEGVVQDQPQLGAVWNGLPTPTLGQTWN